jgi:uncharacterized protein (DUF849 family)
VNVVVAALNGARTGSVGVPVTPGEMAADAARVVAAGATEVHVHPRRPDGTESLAPGDVGTAMEAIASAVPGVPVGISVSAWVEANPRRRIAQIANWPVLPTYAAVNVYEEGAVEVADALQSRGVAVEAALFSQTAAEIFLRGPWRALATRILIEPVDRPPLLAVHDALAMMEVLDRYGIFLPRLLHGDGENTWAVLREAREQGLGLRIGYEDTFRLPDGRLAPSNAALVQAALGVAPPQPGMQGVVGGWSG